jgi:excisionase family DNA binding protein
MEPLPGYKTPGELADELGHSTPRLVQRWIKEGRVTAYRVGKQAVAIPDAEVERLKAEDRKPGRPKRGG